MPPQRLNWAEPPPAQIYGAPPVAISAGTPEPIPGARPRHVITAPVRRGDTQGPFVLTPHAYRRRGWGGEVERSAPVGGAHQVRARGARGPRWRARRLPPKPLQDLLQLAHHCLLLSLVVVDSKDGGRRRGGGGRSAGGGRGHQVGTRPCSSSRARKGARNGAPSAGGSKRDGRIRAGGVRGGSSSREGRPSGGRASDHGGGEDHPR
jgi:hypothetical protein